jgi:hypothetical protein
MPFKFLSTNVITDYSTGEMDIYEDEPLSISSAYHSNDPSLSALLDKKSSNLFTWSAGTGTNTCLHLSLAAATNINVLLLQNINFSKFEIQINSLAVSPIGADTTTAFWDSWTDENLYLEFSTIAAQTIDVYVYTTTSGGDRECGQIIATELQYELPWNPNFSDYLPTLSGRRQQKIMSDGGIKTYSIAEKFKASFRLNYVPPSVTSGIRDLYNSDNSYIFVPFATTTGWDGDAWEINFVGEYNLKQAANNDTSDPYYKGSIIIAETAQ